MCGKFSSEKFKSGINLFNIFLLLGPPIVAVAK